MAAPGASGRDMIPVLSEVAGALPAAIVSASESATAVHRDTREAMRATRGLQPRALREGPRVALAKHYELAVPREHQAVEKRHAQHLLAISEPSITTNRIPRGDDPLGQPRGPPTSREPPYSLCGQHPYSQLISFDTQKESAAMSRPARKEERIDVRLDREAKATITRAAALRHQSVSDFILSATLERCQEVIERANVIRLSEHEAGRFLAALANPPAPSPKLRKAAEKYRKALAKGRLEVR